MEDVVELGFEGVDRITDRYHDSVYDRLPAVPRFKRGKRNKDRQSERSQRSERSPHPDKGYSRPDSAYSDDASRAIEDREMYAPDRRQERNYQDRDDERYYGGERTYVYKGPAAGALVPRNNDDDYDSRGYQPYQDYNQLDYDQPRGRPGPQRRGSSWSPPRSRKHRDSHKPRSSSRHKDKEHRIVAAVGGAIAGGFAAHKLTKSNEKYEKYEQVATVVGAIVGGLGGKEAAEFWDNRHRKDDEKEENWEEEWNKPENTGSQGKQRDGGRQRDR